MTISNDCACVRVRVRERDRFSIDNPIMTVIKME
jgi:hypothetical protein